eukprot:CAMPEP_0197029842 /NCGR_PEP_ID=MMETSP1384-20130603/9204_1 /TAXON_ID=29189 /ORGANISM="Ammonia sp." /LENGTH=684 /DNA_ID=CAMNT_0042459081 /DNA_START=27 /DNA_END=2081 /DNA_ORIENTATION=-
MDDLGYTDVNYNGGVIPTPTLNKLSSEGIRINYHYANTICSASRSSLLTGRYSWRTGAANIIYQQTTQHTNTELPFISNVLKSSSSSYNTAMFGKYHLGYSSQSYLPFNRGFDKTLFFEAGATSYSKHLSCPSWPLIFNTMHIDVDTDMQQALESKFSDGFCSHDLWNEEYVAMEGTTFTDGVYNELLFTNAVKEYIHAHQDEQETPFFIYYAMPTPHWPLEEPPKTYAECDGDERQAFCNVLMYGDELIGEIVETLHATQQYEDTLIIFLSDNGPNPNWKSDIDLPAGYGQTLPLRGAKGSTFEGGIRTPAFVYGGYVDAHCENAGGEYNRMVHISDWFAVIRNVAGMAVDGDKMDIDGVDLWSSICHSDHSLTRSVIQHFEMVDVNDKDQGFKASYIRTNDWKLLVNPSLSFIEIPSNQYWVNYDATFSTKPPQEKYAALLENTEIAHLFESKCYNEYLRDSALDENVNEDMFAYEDLLLFKISEDNVEACNVAKEHPQIVQALMKLLFSTGNLNEYVTFNSDAVQLSKQGVLAQIQSYDCDTQKAYHLSWQELEQYSGTEADVALSWNEIFQEYIDVVEKCDAVLVSRQQKQQAANAPNGIFYELEDGGFARFFIVGASLLSATAILLVVSLKLNDVYPFNQWKLKDNNQQVQVMEADASKKNTRKRDVDEYTVLLPANVK